MNVQNFYNNEFDESSRLTQNDNRHKIELFRKQFLYSHLIGKYQPTKVVQIACGTGIHTSWLCKTYPHIHFYASDIIPKHVEQIPDFDNLDKRVWDCCDELPVEYMDADMILVEGAWYHLNKNQRALLLDNIDKMNPKVVIIDWLSAWHELTQRMLQDKRVPLDLLHLRPESPFIFDTEIDLKFLALHGKIQLSPVDMDLRFGYNDFNSVSDEEFNKFITYMNKCITLYDADQTFIMNATEHGCYILTKEEINEKIC